MARWTTLRCCGVRRIPRRSCVLQRRSDIEDVRVDPANKKHTKRCHQDAHEHVDAKELRMGAWGVLGTPEMLIRGGGVQQAAGSRLDDLGAWSECGWVKKIAEEEGVIWT